MPLPLRFISPITVALIAFSICACPSALAPDTGIDNRDCTTCNNDPDPQPAANSGDLDWNKRFGGISGDRVEAIVTDAQGNIYVAGWFAGELLLGGSCANLTSLPFEVHTEPGFEPYTRGTIDAYVAKFSAEPERNCVWAKRYGDVESTSFIHDSDVFKDQSEADEAQDIALDSNGNLIVVGSFWGSVNFGVQTLSAGGAYKSFILKMNSSNGAEQWVQALSEYSPSVAVDSANNIYVTNQNRKLAKFNASGALQWDLPAASIHGRDIALDASGNSYVATQFYNNIVTNEGTLVRTGNSWDSALVTYDSSGVAQWARRVGGSGSGDDAGGVAVDGNNILFAGSFESQAKVGLNADTESSIDSVGGRDIFIARYTSTGELDWIRRHGAEMNDYAQAVAVAADHSLYVTGEFRTNVDFGDGLHEGDRTNGQLYVMRLAPSNGATVWSRDFVDSGAQYAPAITTDAQGGVITAGYFVHYLNFLYPDNQSERVSSAGSFDVIMARYYR